MAKRLLLLLASMFGMALQGRAQSNFTFEAPAFQKIVKVTGNNVNIRQKPSAQSTRVDQVGKGEALAVIGESEEWYKVCNSHWIAPYAEDGGNATMQITIVGYIMKKFCEDAVLNLPKDDAYGFYVRPSGRHKGVCLWYSYSGHEEDWYGLTFAIGKQVGDLYILPYRISVNGYSETTKRIECKSDEYGRYNLEFKEGIIEGSDINFDQLTDADIDYLIANTSKMSRKSGRVVFFTDDTANEMTGYSDINYGDGADMLPLKQY